MNEHLERITQAIEAFDAYDSVLFHAELELALPSGFLRYTTTNQVPDMHWDPVDVRMGYNHKKLRFSVKLREVSHVPSFTIVPCHAAITGEMPAYTVTDEIWLSLQDAKELLIYLQNYFRCFDFGISTKLLR